MFKKRRKKNICLLDDIFFFGEKRKPQRGRKATAPLHTPRAFFEGVLGCGDGRLLTCGCILRCWDVGGCADRVVRGRRGVLLLLGLRVDKFFYFLLAIAGKLHV